MILIAKFLVISKRCAFLRYQDFPYEVRKDHTKPSELAFARHFQTSQLKSEWLSYKERRVDALALRADERRDKLR